MKSAIALVLLFVVKIYAEEALNDVLMNDDDRHPYVQCKIDLYDCIRLGTKNKTQCLVDYKNCMSVLVPTVPPTVSKCNSELKTCLSTSSGFLDKAKCFTAYGKCLIPTEHPYFKCKIDLGTCLKDGTTGKLKCMTNYKNCMAQLFPTVPPYVSKCNSVLSSCISNAGDFLDISQCSVDYGRCIKKGSSS